MDTRLYGMVILDGYEGPCLGFYFYFNCLSTLFYNWQAFLSKENKKYNLEIKGTHEGCPYGLSCVGAGLVPALAGKETVLP